MEKNCTYDIGIMTASEMIEFQGSLPDTYGDWPIYCCGSDECYFVLMKRRIRQINFQIHGVSVDTKKR